MVAARSPWVESRRARAFVLGLLAYLPRKNCWTIAEHAEDASLGGTRHFLARAGGTPTRSVMTCAANSPSGWASGGQCW